MDEAELSVLERNLLDARVIDPVVLLVIEPAPDSMGFESEKLPVVLLFSEPAPKGIQLFPGKLSWPVGGMLSTVMSL
jgi:hypothetical protein